MKSETSRPTIPCPNCKGCGRMFIAHQYLTTLNALKRLGTASAAQLHSTLGMNVGITAVNNWLEFLRRHGLAARKKINRMWVYRATRP